MGPAGTVTQQEQIHLPFTMYLSQIILGEEEVIQLLGNDRGNPGVSRAVPLPLPLKTPTLTQG
jgi:hypothetical protein